MSEDDDLVVGWRGIARALGVSKSSTIRIQDKLPIVWLGRRPAVRMGALRRWFALQEKFIVPSASGDGFDVIAGRVLSVHVSEAEAEAAAMAARADH
jgi:hypothetical protein